MKIEIVNERVKQKYIHTVLSQENQRTLDNSVSSPFQIGHNQTHCQQTIKK